MYFTKSVDLSANGQVRDSVIPKVLILNEDTKYLIMFAYAAFILLSSFLFSTPMEIISGVLSIAIHPSILVSDYVSIGGIGSAFFNSGILMIISICLARLNKIKINGTIIAAVFTVGGFAFFGKNIYNIWPIFLGIYIYSRVQKDKFSKFILVALFSTALAPLVSQVSFGMGFPVYMGVILGNLFGVTAGFIAAPLANHMVKFHQGYNIYNVGFTAGVIGTLFMALFRSFGLENTTTFIAASGYTNVLGIFLFFFFTTMILLGYILNNKSFSGYANMLERAGRLVTDFAISDGFGLCFINMGILGLVSTGYIALIGGEINGPIIGGIFTIVGFGAFGKHLKNILPIFIGVYIASLLQIWDVTATGALLAALFGTTLAPIAGEFGWKSGIAAGFIHMAMVMNVGYLHGGMNLYNNGFSGGIVAAILVPIITALRK